MKDRKITATNIMSVFFLFLALFRVDFYYLGIILDFISFSFFHKKGDITKKSVFFFFHDVHEIDSFGGGQ